MADLRLNISSDSRRAQQDVDSLRREIQTLRTQLGQAQQGSTSAGRAIDEMGNDQRVSKKFHRHSLKVVFTHYSTFFKKGTRCQQTLKFG